MHDLRHTYASIALTQGLHPKVVSEALGHSTVARTLDVYSHVVPSLQREAARAMGVALFGSAQKTAVKRTVKPNPRSRHGARKPA